MPLRAIEPESGRAIHSFDLKPDEWNELAALNRRRRHLRLPCCSATVTLRRSRRGTQFFAHKALGECTTGPETEVHLRLKQLVVEVARAHGWEAQTEVAGRTPSGDCWTADVLATRGSARVAIEIQWSGQTADETEFRQSRYATSGVRGLWLMRRLSARPSGAVPAAQISQSEDGDFFIDLPSGRGQSLPVPDFLNAAFEGRLKFGLPLGARVTASVQVGTAPCWSCGAFTTIITDIGLSIGPHELSLSVADFDGADDLFSLLHANFPSDLEIGAIKRRYSKALRRSYLSNGCAHCDALFGQFFEHDAYADRDTILTTAFPLDERWKKLFETDEECTGWGVFQFD